MKKILFVTVAIFASTLAFAARITNFNEMQAELRSGKNVRVIVDASKCQVEAPADSKIKSLGFQVTNFWEREAQNSNNATMRVISSGARGLSGNERSYLVRTTLNVWEDNVVTVYGYVADYQYFLFSDPHIKIKCKLSADGSGGVTMISVSDI